ncbi:DUF1446 domain-containing protein [Acuticoccus sp. M5D2P5]|uniref:acyclic terpene utilization AtuA family protein n=1 Tax=Acuticoccus kalidii TaxID=2910977 RepID=UPI001F28260E|nr:acyclic terpene utilization AtuA family protein [Acuticoccus kalidii]MCF3933988.1 DUF1446 domain-containing protein [Acuticoccus kalidii]
MTYRIGSGAGFSGDRVDAAGPVVAELARHGGGAIIFETIGERTLALGQAARLGDANLGYEPLLEAFLGPIIADAVKGNVRIVGNFGVANPDAAARHVAAIARAAGVADVRIAVVEGDDIRTDFQADSATLWDGDGSLPPPAGDVISANVYIGARAIADAITAGADIVVTGRVADPALALGPLVAHFGWDWDDLDRIAAGTLIGHLLECGSQVSGGYFADPGFKDVPDPDAIGFPIAEVEADGSFVITKPAETGGLVDLRTVKEQLLYEIHDPAAYLTPDVTLDITGVDLRQVGRDRVAVTGARGHARPDTLKATIGFEGEWFGESEISYAGPNALARAELAADTIKKRIARRGLDVTFRLDLIGVTSAFDDDGGSLRANLQPGPDDVRVRLAAKSVSKPAVSHALQEVLALYCCGPAGGGGHRSSLNRRIETRSYLVPRDLAVESWRFVGEGVSAPA